MIKNVLDTCVSAIAFWLIGYTLAFGDGSLIFGWTLPDGQVRGNDAGTFLDDSGKRHRTDAEKCTHSQLCP